MQKLTEEEVIRQYQNIVFYHAHRMKGSYEFEDLVSEGYIGLLKAYRAYNEDLGAFGAMAQHYVQGWMLKLIRKPSRGVHIPHEIVLIMWKINRMDLRDKPAEEIAERINEKVGHVEKALLAMSYITTGINPDIDGGTTQDDTTHIDVQLFIKTLTDREKLILYLIDEGETQRDIASRLGTYQTKIRRELKVIKGKYTKWSEMV